MSGGADVTFGDDVDVIFGDDVDGLSGKAGMRVSW